MSLAKISLLPSPLHYSVTCHMPAGMWPWSTYQALIFGELSSSFHGPFWEPLSKQLLPPPFASIGSVSPQLALQFLPTAHKASYPSCILPAYCSSAVPSHSSSPGLPRAAAKHMVASKTFLRVPQSSGSRSFSCTHPHRSALLPHQIRVPKALHCSPKPYGPCHPPAGCTSVVVYVYSL